MPSCACKCLDLTRHLFDHYLPDKTTILLLLLQPAAGSPTGLTTVTNGRRRIVALLISSSCCFASVGVGSDCSFNPSSIRAPTPSLGGRVRSRRRRRRRFRCRPWGGEGFFFWGGWVRGGVKTFLSLFLVASGRPLARWYSVGGGGIERGGIAVETEEEEGLEGEEDPPTNQPPKKVGRPLLRSNASRGARRSLPRVGNTANARVKTILPSPLFFSLPPMTSGAPKGRKEEEEEEGASSSLRF